MRTLSYQISHKISATLFKSRRKRRGINPSYAIKAEMGEIELNLQRNPTLKKWFIKIDPKERA